MPDILVVDKPQGWTSHDVVNFYRQKLHIKKIGHAGTLDPFATGVLVLLIGPETKKFDDFRKLEKEYELTVELGWQTETGDPEGRITKKLSTEAIKRAKLTKTKIEKVIESFQGESEQEVPAFSAIKYKGKPLYEYARRGFQIALPKRIIEIQEIELLKFDPKGDYPKIKLRIVCSSGTYMRSLAVDIGGQLGLPAVATELRRTRIGKYTLASAEQIPT